MPKSARDNGTTSTFGTLAQGRARRRQRTVPSIMQVNGTPLYSLSKFTDDQQSFIHRNVLASINALKLKLSTVTKPQLGTRVLSANSTSSYTSNLRQLEYFLALIGDWSSMLILREDSPDFAPAILDSSLTRFIDWKFQEKGTAMKDANGRPLMDAFNRPLVADGCWSSPDNTVPFSAAVSTLHVAHGFMNMPYTDVNCCITERYIIISGGIFD